MTAALERLRAGAAALGIPLDDAACARFDRYITELMRWRSRLNLTGADTPENIAVPHLLESILPVAVWRFPHDGRAVDIGSGAGFPGIPIKIVRPDLKMTLVEASRRRVAFLEHLRGALDSDDLMIEWGRAEDLGRRPAMRDAYDCAVERATAKTPMAAELSLPFVAPGGAAILLKGSAALADLARCTPLIAALGGEVEDVVSRSLAGAGRAQVVVILRKVRPTPPRFPRRGSRLGRAP